LNFARPRIQEYAVEPVWSSVAGIIASRKGCNVLARDESCDQDPVIRETKGIRSEMKTPGLLLWGKIGEADSTQVNIPDRASRIGIGSYVAVMARAEG
jgi:hypothetical protein